jgi:Fic family protein
MSAIFVEKTSQLSLQDLYDRIDSANKELNRLCKRSDSVRQNVEKMFTEKLLPEFNFFSLTHEGMCLSFEEIEDMTEVLLTPNHKEGDIPNLVIEDSSCHIQAAMKHIRMSGRIRELSNLDVSKNMIRSLHAAIMGGLLTKEHGPAGTYRKHNLRTREGNERPAHKEIDRLMDDWFKIVELNPAEHVIDFVTRVYTTFQSITPFVKGNGRVGYFLLHILFLKNGYPIPTLTSEAIQCFKAGVRTAGTGDPEVRFSDPMDGDPSLFSRVLAEGVYNTLLSYEERIGLQIL